MSNRIVVVSGSHREGSQSERVANYIEGQLRAQGVDASTVSLARNPLPLWDEDAPSASGAWSGAWKTIRHLLQSADGFVIVTPEWSGMVPAGLKNLLLLAGTEEFGHKPALLVSVSAGIGGSYPIAELRMSGYKNSRLCIIPEHVIIRSVQQMLNEGPPASPHDEATRKRLSYALAVLREYCSALKLVRASGVIDHTNFPHGM